MQDELHDTRFLFQNLMDNMTDMIYFKDLQSRFIMVNRAAATWQGYANPSVAIGKSDFDKYKKEDAQGMFDAEQRIIETGEPIEGIEEKESWKDGQEAWVSTTKMPLRNPTGAIVGTFGVSRNITKHKEAEIRAAYYAQQIERIKEEMEEEVRMAAELQKTFFPRSYPEFPVGVDAAKSAVQFHHHYHASGMVSGDFCSVRRLSETECGVLLCDVMGHGVRAALGTALIYAMVEELTLQEKDPGCFLGRMNELLLPILRQEDTFLYATACYVVFNAETGVVRVANAGHPVPVHLQKSKGEANWLMADATQRGPALAICEGVDYQTVDIPLEPDDSVVMYTDGIYEVIGVDNEEFGEQRLLEATRRHVGRNLPELFPALINDARHYSADGAFDDDVCLVGFTFKDRLEKADEGK
jgi:sigma-B regulation protein RsbU (phosphoserine phosphatase)